MANVVIYTRDYCGYCARAKHLLDERGIAYTEHNASLHPDRRDEMIHRSGRRTFPQIFIDDIHIGGSDDLAAAERSGRLDKALEGAL